VTAAWQMPVTMKGSPLRQSWDTSTETQLKMGGMVFDPLRGGWVQPDAQRAGQSRALPPHWETPVATHPKGLHYASNRTHHYEEPHEGDWKLDMKAEIDLGLAPPPWSVSSKMDDTRPNGKAMFDARFSGSPMGRARGGHAMVADARGIEFAGGTQKAVNMDSNFFAADMADETAAAADSAEKNKYGNNTNFSSFQGVDMALANMSQLQRKQLDKDGDGQYSADELRAYGISA